MSAGQDTPEPAVGLTEPEVQQRIAKGKTNAAARALTTRSVSEILHANAFNSVNIVLLALGTAPPVPPMGMSDAHI
ncbi:hypothetical protein [Candidatus Poriferisocius sp.]|uniref:hypothetical protein n=1 Tax=Candidatus Poriferisocius sp. TaxID=3101276 RepID=UPI003B018180